MIFFNRNLLQIEKKKSISHAVYRGGLLKFESGTIREESKEGNFRTVFSTISIVRL